MRLKEAENFNDVKQNAYDLSKETAKIKIRQTPYFSAHKRIFSQTYVTDHGLASQETE